MIREFYINDLYGERNIRIPFRDEIKIIVAENGYGKTTILNSFYALISGDISKLRKVSFSKIGVVFQDGTDISFEKNDFDVELDLINGHPLFEHIEAKLGRDFAFELINESRRLPMSSLEMSPLIRRASKALDIPTDLIKDLLREIRIGRKSRAHKRINTNTQQKLEEIQLRFSLKTLYLPTYRRVEEDIRAFDGLPNEDAHRSHIIKFGMSDVQKSIKNITSEILSSSVEWFSKINGQMLSQLVNGFEVTDEMKDCISKPRAVEIVLERIGKNISESHKQQILNLVKSGGILSDHEPLIYFVANLLAVYEQQQENDEAIQAFTSVSNKYLGDKEIVYDESRVTIEIVRKKSRKAVDIESLSSGEKQIISLFAILYLEKKTNLAIFFDEPELSLSIEWQRTLLPDILSSGKCQFLFCTTHSPFIFDNNLEGHTVDLAKYIEEL